MPTRQILRRLATASQHSSSTSASSSAASSSSASTHPAFAPPYTHSLSSPSAPSSAFRPPYEHSTTASSSTSSSQRLKAPLRFSLLPSTSAHDTNQVEAFNTWARGLLSTEQGREIVWRKWVESVIALEHVKSTGNQIPEVSFHSLAAHLQNESTVDAIRSTGAIVVRDVVADAEAQGWAREILEEMDERQGRAVYWHDALLAARAHTSVLSANNQLLSALTGETGEALIQADAAQVGAAAPGARTTSLDNAWTVDTNSVAPITPLLSHLSLTTSTSAGNIPPTIHAAIYTSLRPLFTPSRSKISFYDQSSYLDPANWRLIDDASTLSSSALPSYTPSGTPSFPHLTGASVSVPRLLPGDMILRHSAIPIAGSSGSAVSADQGIFLPLTPLPRVQANEAYVQEQRLAFEQGLPPLHARVAEKAIGDEGMVALEREGERGLIGSRGGKRAMGYA